MHSSCCCHLYQGHKRHTYLFISFLLLGWQEFILPNFMRMIRGVWEKKNSFPLSSYWVGHYFWLTPEDKTLWKRVIKGHPSSKRRYWFEFAHNHGNSLFAWREGNDSSLIFRTLGRFRSVFVVIYEVQYQLFLLNYILPDLLSFLPWM